MVGCKLFLSDDFAVEEVQNQQKFTFGESELVEGESAVVEGESVRRVKAIWNCVQYVVYLK
jgi:hypothetical protein